MPQLAVGHRQFQRAHRLHNWRITGGWVSTRVGRKRGLIMPPCFFGFRHRRAAPEFLSPDGTADRATCGILSLSNSQRHWRGLASMLSPMYIAEIAARQKSAGNLVA